MKKTNHLLSRNINSYLLRKTGGNICSVKNTKESLHKNFEGYGSRTKCSNSNEKIVEI